MRTSKDQWESYATMGHNKRRGTSLGNHWWEKYSGIESINYLTYENIKNELSRPLKSELQKEMVDMKQWQVNHEDTARILADIDILKKGNENLRNISMTSTLIFKGVPEREQSDSCEEDLRYLSEYLANKLDMDL